MRTAAPSGCRLPRRRGGRRWRCAPATIGVDRVAKAAPDGYTLGYSGDGAMVVRPSMDPPTPYDPRRDLVPITLLFRTRNVVAVHPSVPSTTLAALIALARAEP